MARSFQQFSAPSGDTGPVHPAHGAPEGPSHNVKGLGGHCMNLDNRSVFNHLCNIPLTCDME